MKLIIPSSGDLASIIHAGSVVRWHKREGDRVGYGDDLFDFRVEEAAVSERSVQLGTQIADVNERPTEYAAIAARQLAGPRLTGEEFHREGASGPMTPLALGDRAFLIRVTSSDRGVVRRIYSSEEERQQAGDILAVLTTEEDEPLNDNAALQELPVFRAVANISGSGVKDGAQPPNGSGRIEDDSAGGKLAGKRFVVFWSGSPDEVRIGIHAHGGVDLDWLFAAAPRIRSVFKGCCCVIRGGSIGTCRSDLLLQKLQDLPQHWVEPLVEKFSPGANLFQSSLFSRRFRPPVDFERSEFPSSLVLLSILPDISAVAYRHRDHGFLLGLPGPLEQGDASRPAVRERASWFRENFINIGRIAVEQFVENFTKVIAVIKEDVGAHVMVVNTLTGCRGRPTHCYQFLKNHESMRRLEFNIALTELSRTLDFPVLDVDRLVKQTGNRTQVDWDRVGPDVQIRIAEEAFGIMRELGLF